MPRPVREFDLFWGDRDFKRSLQRLSESDRQERLSELTELVRDLSDCRHPTHDPALQRWRPSAYHVRNVDSSQVKLFEYRCAYPMRVIVRWIDPTPEEPAGVVLLVAATLSHDHERLKEVIRRNRQDLAGYPQE
ncbi:MAG TPA: hypothetical protein VFR31_09985 [Thermoanaerobaculia bacterium]|nr:hypothetical protein [Thermoanaerobaculia bacterium]